MVEVWADVGVIGGQGGGATGAGAGLQLVGPAEAETTGINIPLCSPTVSEAMIPFICWAIGCCSVGDPEPDPDPQDLHVFWPPGSRSISPRYASGSVSFPFSHKDVERTEIMLAK